MTKTEKNSLIILVVLAIIVAILLLVKRRDAVTGNTVTLAQQLSNIAAANSQTVGGVPNISGLGNNMVNNNYPDLLTALNDPLSNVNITGTATPTSDGGYNVTYP